MALLSFIFLLFLIIDTWLGQFDILRHLWDVTKEAFLLDLNSFHRNPK